MGSYLLKVGRHEGADKSKPPKKTKDGEGNEVLTYPNRVYHAGETIESDVDLVKVFGPEKFSYPFQTPALSVPEIDRQIAELQKRREEMAAKDAAVPTVSASAVEPTKASQAQSEPSGVVDSARVAEVAGQPRRGR